MNWIGLLLLVIHVASCIALILIVLLQAGKGASLGAAFGGGSSQTVFGARSASFMGRFTWALAGAFMLTSLLLTMISPWGEKTLHAEPTALHEETTVLPPLGEEALPAPLPEDLTAPAPSDSAMPEAAMPEAAMPAPDASSAMEHAGDAQSAPVKAPTPAEPTP